MPEKIFSKLNIERTVKICFMSALLFGLLAHFYKITNHIPNWDSLVFRYDAHNMTECGRWFLGLICAVTGFYELPFLNGILAIFYTALSSAVICKIFNIKEDITAVLTGGLIASFPTVTSVMMYAYVSDGYSFAFLLSTLSVYFMVRKKPDYILSGVLIALSMGIYQAYISVTVMLLLLYLIGKTVFDGKDAKYLFKKSLLYLLTGIGGIVLYYLVLLLILEITGTELLDYQGLKSSASMQNFDILASFYVIYKSFIKTFFDFSKGIAIYPVLNIIVFAFGLVAYFGFFIKNKVFSSVGKTVLLLIYTVFLPIGSVILVFVNPMADYHNLMKMGYAVFYLFFIFIFDKKFSGKYTKWGVLIISSVLIFNQVVIANSSYHIAQISYEKSMSTLIRITDRIENTENSKNCKKILVVGQLDNSEDYSYNFPPDITGITEGLILRADDEIVGQSVLTEALFDYSGKDYEFISGNEKKLLLEKDEIIKMKNWPDKESVKVMDDILIIKLSEEAE